MRTGDFFATPFTRPAGSRSTVKATASSSPSGARARPCGRRPASPARARGASLAGGRFRARTDRDPHRRGCSGGRGLSRSRRPPGRAHLHFGARRPGAPVGHHPRPRRARPSADLRLHDLGLVQLRDIDRPERLFQLVVDGLPEAFPPPRRTRHSRWPPCLADLLERDAELAALDALIAAAPAGGRLLAIEGPAGIGKTRLLAEARIAVRAAGMQVLAARGSELERRVLVRSRTSTLRAAARRRVAGRAGRAARGCGGARNADFRSRPPRRRAGCGLVAGDAPRSLLADREPRRAPARSCSRSTTCTGAIRRRCAGSRTSCRDWRICRS